MSPRSHDVRKGPTAEDEVVELLSDLIRIDTTSGAGPERPAAEWVAAKLDEVGVTSQIIEAAPGRASTVARVEGRDPDRPPLLVQGHLDVVPADADEWSVHPFSGEVRDGYVWGRGAVDMKHMLAMILALVREWARTQRKPARDVVLAFVADEEAGGQYGSLYLVEHFPELFADCAEAIGEVGGFSMDLGENKRLYPVQTAEKGLEWLRLRASGRGGHGSTAGGDNALTRLAAVLSRVGAHEFQPVVSDAVQRTIGSISNALGIDLDPQQLGTWPPQLKKVARQVASASRNTATPTSFHAGRMANVIPAHAEATIDARFLPGQEDALLAALDELIGEGVEREILARSVAVETTFDGQLVEAMCGALRAADAGAVPVPYLMSSGTDAKAFSRLGIRCFGFTPVLMPAGLEFEPLFHGVNERVPVEGLQFGVRVLDQTLSSC
jgi:acetylornithine deacetylase/succinyl-diaminopimelate desuccinylase-like protein